MSNNYQIFLISDSTGETLDRIFLSLKAQFKNIEYKVNSYSFTRTENQILKILSEAEKSPSAVILYSIVDSNLAKYLAHNSKGKLFLPTIFTNSTNQKIKIMKIEKRMNNEVNHHPYASAELITVLLE